MSWDNEVNEIKKRLKLIQEMGGKEKVKRQHDAGRTTVRQRIEALVDKNSFKEIGRLTGLSEYNDNGILKKLTPVNSVIGHAKINNIPVVIYGDDFTVRGGAADAAIHEKMIAAERFANEYKMPLIRLIEGTGGGGSSSYWLCGHPPCSHRNIGRLGTPCGRPGCPSRKKFGR